MLAKTSNYHYSTEELWKQFLQIHLASIYNEPYVYGLSEWISVSGNNHNGQLRKAGSEISILL